MVHSNIIKIFEVIKTPDSLLVITEPQEPTNLRDFFPISQSEFKVVLGDMLRMLRYCHSRNVILRNISPKSISVKKRSGQVIFAKYGDFSCACLSYTLREFPLNEASWDIVPYLSPESIMDNKFTVASDYW